MGPIWDHMGPNGQPAYGLTHMGSMWNPAALPIWVAHMGPIKHFCWETVRSGVLAQ